MTTVEWATILISLFGMVGTVGAAIAAMQSSSIASKTLKEQTNNNKTLLKPFIVVEEKEFEFSVHDNEPFYLLNWDTGDFNLKDSSNSIGIDLNVLNLSKGIAKNVKVNFEMDNYQTFISKLIESNNYDNFTFSIDDHRFLKETSALYLKGEFSNETRKKRLNNVFRLENFPTQKFIFLPEFVNGQTNKVQFPPVFFVLYNLYFRLDPSINFDEYLNLKIRIECQDVVGNDYTFNYIYRIKRYNVKDSTEERRNVKIIFEVIEE